MAPALAAFSKLPPRLRAAYAAALALSVALLVFGAVLLASNSMDGGGRGVGGGLDGVDGFGGASDDDVGDFFGGDDGYPTASPAFGTASPTDVETAAPSTVNPTTADPTTFEPSPPPSLDPSPQPSASPERSPTRQPVTPRPTKPIDTFRPTEPIDTTSPTAVPSAPPTPSPTERPTFQTRPVPLDPPATYFDYDPTSPYGPWNWGNVEVLNATENYWSEFGLVANECNTEGVPQSPIDVCTRPERHCQEYHEFRSKRGDFKINGDFLEKQILPNKLRILVARRDGDEPDPPHVDFSGVGFKDLDLLNIDIKIPSEHTVCGKRYDGEMQYYFFHPVRRSLLVVAWLLEANAEYEANEHVQLLIDAFQEVHDATEEDCMQQELFEDEASTEAQASDATNGTAFLRRRRMAKDDKKGGNGIWDPFHRDIQKTIHFWGYTGTLTEPPCSAGTLWRIMDVPVPLAPEQLQQMARILFDQRDGATCAPVGTHHRGSVARPRNVGDPARYYKCTRDDYVSDDEREVCGDEGCSDPFGEAVFGTGLDPYVAPIVHVTGPPSEPPTMSPS
ncbi:hypothetical protein ACHAXT_009060 [Thalassiosira profunda]